MLIRCADCGIQRSVDFESCVNCNSIRWDVFDEQTFACLVTSATNALKSQGEHEIVASLIAKTKADEGDVRKLVAAAAARRLKSWQSSGRWYINLGVLGFLIGLGGSMLSKAHQPETPEEVLMDRLFSAGLVLLGILTIFLGASRSAATSVPKGR